MEFKGTKGKWEADEDHVATLNESIHGNIICVIPEHYYPDSRENWEYNALLISKAPEMLEMLNNKLSYIEEIAMLIPSKEWTEKFRDKFNHEMNSLEQLIKEATEL